METQKFSESKLTPIKNCFISDETRMMKDNKQQPVMTMMMHSPFPSTPSKIIDFSSFYLKNSNGKTSLNDSLFSPFVSASQKKNEYKWLRISKQLFTSESSPYNSQFSGGQNNYLNCNFNNNNKEYCRNLTSQFESAVEFNNDMTEECIIERNQSPMNFCRIKKALFGNNNKYTIPINEDINLNSIGEYCNNNANKQKISLRQLNHIYIDSLTNQKQGDDGCIDYDYDEEEEDEKSLEISNDEDLIEDKGVFDINSTTRSPLIGKLSECSTCKCSKSKCLKLYCECFANGNYCHGCSCINCFNTENYEIQRQKALKRIITNNPKAMKILKQSRKCHCRNSSCRKNYCDCYQNSKYCSSKCKCLNCLNKPLIKQKKGNPKKTAIKTKPKPKSLKTIEPKYTLGRKQNREKADLASVEYNNAMYTPQNKNYRNFKSDIKNTISTAVFTELTKSNNRKPKPRLSRVNNNQSIMCKKLKLKED